MKLEFENKATGGRFIMAINDSQTAGSGIVNGHGEHFNTIVVNKHYSSQQITIDEIVYTMPGHSIVPLISYQRFAFERPEHLVCWQFNRAFYCIVDHDVEVSCVGFLFFGIHHPLFISLTPEELNNIEIIERMLLDDMKEKDRMQEEMLRTLLKRLIIKSTRMAKLQTAGTMEMADEKLDVLRQFNLLVEVNYKKEHEVSFYARSLNRSPKTLTNFFRLCHYPSPSALIHQRIIMEAKRFLHYTNRSAKEIGYELGFDSPAHFSRFFKLKTGANLSIFRNKLN